MMFLGNISSCFYILITKDDFVIGLKKLCVIYADMNCK